VIKRVTISILKIVVSLALISFLLIRLGIEDIFNQFASANLGWLLVAIAAFTVSNFLGSLQWDLLLRYRDIKLAFSRIMSYYFVGLFFNNFLIGYVGGDAFRIYDISRVSGDSSSAFSTVFFDRFIGFVMLTSLALLAGLMWHGIFQSQTVIVVILIIFVCWIISFFFLFSQRMAKKIRWLVALIFTPKINSKIREIYLNINSFRSSKGTLLWIVLISTVIQALRIIVHYFVALSVGLDIHIKYFFVFIPIIALLSSLPISIGGIGVRESSAIALFSQVNGFQPETIMAMEFLAYMIGLISTIPGGIIFMLRKEISAPA